MSITLEDLKPDAGILCDDCDTTVAVLVGIVFHQTYWEPEETVQLCAECAGDDPIF